MSQFALEKRRLGRTEFRVTPIGLGGAHLGRTPSGFDDDLAVHIVHRALRLGINLIDTAPMYEGSEHRIGVALAQWFASGGHRDDVILSTKAGRDPHGGKHYTAQAVFRSVAESLHHLNTDYLDIVLVHDPDDLRSVFGPGGALEALRELKSKGTIRAIGVGVRDHQFHRHCIRSGEFDVCLTFCDYNLMDQSALQGVVLPAAAHDVGVLNGAAVMLGLLGGGDPRRIAPKLGSFATPDRLQRACELWDWARRRGLDLLALNLQLCVREKRIASTLLGVSNPRELETDVQALSTHIPSEAWQELAERFGICCGSEQETTT